MSMRVLLINVISLVIGASALAAAFLTEIKPRYTTGIQKYQQVSDTQFSYYFELTPDNTFMDPAPFPLSYTPTYTINKDGLKERFDYATSTPPNTFRIITLGDSWTFGQFVNTPDTFPEVLEDALNEHLACDTYDAFEVINMGAPSYDVQYAVERYHRKGEKYDPDLVVWFLVENDFNEIGEYIRTYTSRESTTTNNVMHVNVAQPNNELRRFNEAREKLHQEYGIDGLIAFQRAALRDINSHYSGELLLYSIPRGYSIPKAFHPIINDFARERPRTIWHQSTFDDMQNSGLLFPDYHPNVRGHAAIADDLFTFIHQQYLPECSLHMQRNGNKFNLLRILLF